MKQPLNFTGNRFSKNRKQPPEPTGSSCPACKMGELLVRTSRFSGEKFYGCSQWPRCNFTRPIEGSGKCSDLEKQADALLMRAGRGDLCR